MNLTTLKLLLAALCITAACDPRSQLVPTRGSTDELAPPPKSTESDCSGCYKWSAKPPGGVNGPPWSA